MSELMAEYSHRREIKGRGVIQLIFEITSEADDSARRVLGPMPPPGESKWFKISSLGSGEAGDGGDGA